MSKEHLNDSFIDLVTLLLHEFPTLRLECLVAPFSY